MRDRDERGDARSDLERMGESAGAMAGRAADFGLEVTGALFRSAADMLGGWWSSDEPARVASDWGGDAERRCREHYSAAAADATGATGAARADAAGDGFERAKPGYQLGWVAKRNPAYRNRGFADVEPELRRVWESRAKTVSSASPGAGAKEWPEMRPFVDFAYQHADER